MRRGINAKVVNDLSAVLSGISTPNLHPMWMFRSSHGLLNNLNQLEC